MEQEAIRFKTKTMVKMGIMIAMVYLATFFIKVPSINGYVHLGDCMIFLSVLILGRKKGAIAGGIGASLADYLSGYMVWVVPTFFIKFIMAFIMGTIAEKVFPKLKFGWIIGSIVGGVIQIMAYTLVRFPLFGSAVAFAELPMLIAQTVSGIILADVLVSLLKEYGVIGMIKEL